MSRREDVDNAIWADPAFEELSPQAKLVYLWSFTNPRCGMAGLYRCGLRPLVMETGLPGDDAKAALVELEQARFVYFDGQMVFVRSRVKHLRNRSKTMATSVRRDVDAAGGHPFVGLWWSENRSARWVQGDSSWTPVGVQRFPAESTVPEDSYGTPPGVPGQGQGQGQGQGVGVGRTTSDGRASDLPEHLAARLPVVAQVLDDVAVRKHADRLTDHELRRSLADFPDRDHEGQAAVFADWWLHGNGRKRTVGSMVHRWRKWLADSAASSGGGTGTVSQRLGPMAAALEQIKRQDAEIRAEEEGVAA